MNTNLFVAMALALLLHVVSMMSGMASAYGAKVDVQVLSMVSGFLSYLIAVRMSEGR